MTAATLGRADLVGLAADLVGAGIEVIAPLKVAGRIEYRRLDRASLATLAQTIDLSNTLPATSLKAEFFPPTEPLCRWHRTHDGVRVIEVPLDTRARVVLGARPCDAAAIEILDKVMGWDYSDEPWFARRAATTIVSVACPSLGEGCFCDAMKLGPASAKGADVLLVIAPNGPTPTYRVQVKTDKGAALVEKHPSRFGTATGPEPLIPATPPSAIHIDTVRGWLGAHFDHPMWSEFAARCHGCGACAAVCPSCHCFDIVDEAEAHDHGTRRRAWDTCQTGLFTLHGSGHNPRSNQSARTRQRVMHKVRIYPERFGELLCTGCGRCARACPGGVDITEILETITRLADGAPVAATR